MRGEPRAPAPRRALPVELVSYGAAGVVAALVDLSVFSGLTVTRVLDPLVANLISRTLGGCTCFFLNKVITFRQGLRHRLAAQMTRFWGVFGLSLALSELLLAFLIRGAGLPDVPAKLLTEACLFFLNFALLRSWAFR
jgi:putative flippase GtrA